MIIFPHPLQGSANRLSAQSRQYTYNKTHSQEQKNTHNNKKRRPNLALLFGEWDADQTLAALLAFVASRVEKLSFAVES